MFLNQTNQIEHVPKNMCLALHVLDDSTFHLNSNVPVNNQHMYNQTRLSTNKTGTNQRDPHTEIMTKHNSNRFDADSHPRKMKRLRKHQKHVSESNKVDRTCL